jgi:hypothetical protein
VINGSTHRALMRRAAVATFVRAVASRCLRATSTVARW